MSETPTDTDRVELTDAEHELLASALLHKVDHIQTKARLVQDAVESIVAARLSALTAERDDLRQTVRANSDSANQRSMSISAELVKNAALQRLADESRAEADDLFQRLHGSRAELAAANDRIAELTELFDGLRDDYQKACEEVERLQHHGWEDENADLQATLDRVTAVANEHWDWKAGRSLHDALRAALTPEGTE